MTIRPKAKTKNIVSIAERDKKNAMSAPYLFIINISSYTSKSKRAFQI